MVGDVPAAPALGDVSPARAEYELQLHRAHLRAMRAVVRREPTLGLGGPALAIDTMSGSRTDGPALLREAGRDAAREVLARLDRELTDLDAALAALPEDAEARPMSSLARALELDPDQLDFLWTAVALAGNPPMRVHVLELDDLALNGLTTTAYCRMVELSPERSRALGLSVLADHPAVKHGLLRAGNLERTPSAWTMAPAIELVCHLAGEPRFDPDCVRLTAPARPILDPRQRLAIATIAQTLGSPGALALFVEGPVLTGRRTGVALAGRPALAIDLARAPTAAGLSNLLLALRRESLLRGAVPVVVGLEELAIGEGPRDERVRIMAHFLDGARGPVVLISTKAGVDVGSRLPSVRVDWPVPDVATRIELWSELVGADLDHGEGGDQQLAQRFPLGAGAIRRAVESARLMVRGRGAASTLTTADLMAGVRHNIAERLGTVAERIAVKQRWDDLVLAEDAMSQVKAVVARVRHAHAVYEDWGYRSKMPRGVGLAALFSGPPGTGKTMVAGLIAQELDLDLYQIDLSKVVSKWVGETEKQLANVFDAAEAGHALLLFDEADALFGQRTTDVKGANDRYANLEVNFLLQRIENFGGVVILTTNLDASIDKALKRRLAAHVVFPHPEDDERAVLWQRMLKTDGAPLADDIDVVELANVFPKMTGANIRNAALGAAFLAVAEGRPTIDHDSVRQAARNEYLAMGQVLSAPTGRR